MHPGEVLRFLLSEEHKDFLLAQGPLALCPPSPLNNVQFCFLFSFSYKSFSHKLSESTKATDILHHKYLINVAALIEEIEEEGGLKVKGDKEKERDR